MQWKENYIDLETKIPFKSTLNKVQRPLCCYSCKRKYTSYCISDDDVACFSILLCYSKLHCCLFLFFESNNHRNYIIAALRKISIYTSSRISSQIYEQALHITCRGNKHIGISYVRYKHFFFPLLISVNDES